MSNMKPVKGFAMTRSPQKLNINKNRESLQLQPNKNNQSTGKKKKELMLKDVINMQSSISSVL